MKATIAVLALLLAAAGAKGQTQTTITNMRCHAPNPSVGLYCGAVQVSFGNVSFSTGGLVGPTVYLYINSNGHQPRGAMTQIPDSSVGYRFSFVVYDTYPDANGNLVTDTYAGEIEGDVTTEKQCSRYCILQYLFNGSITID